MCLWISGRIPSCNHDAAHEGDLKIGETGFGSSSGFMQLPPNCEELNKHAHNRIRQMTHTALVQFELLHTELARREVQLADERVNAVRDTVYMVEINIAKYFTMWYDISTDGRIACE